jgi:hypothetical protein
MQHGSGCSPACALGTIRLVPIRGKLRERFRLILIVTCVTEAVSRRFRVKSCAILRNTAQKLTGTNFECLCIRAIPDVN